MDFTPSKYLFPWLVSPIGFLYFYQFTFSPHPLVRDYLSLLRMFQYCNELGLFF